MNVNPDPSGLELGRQVLARYAFFEQARRSSKHPEDALLPLVLPAIAGRSGDVFNAQVLGDHLKPLLGGALVQSLAESMVAPLVREGYLQRHASTDSGDVYSYTQKANEIPLEQKNREGEIALQELISGLKNYIRVTNPIKQFNESDSELSENLLTWLATKEALQALQFPDLEEDALGSSREILRISPVPKHLRYMFSGFVAWTSRERLGLFKKITILSELALVIDLVSEIRIPTFKQKSANLQIVLDCTPLMELLGMYGDRPQKALDDLMKLCRTKNIGLMTLSHIVDEVKEIAYNVSNDHPNRSVARSGSVEEAMQRYPEIINIVRRVNRAPDAAVRAAGIAIIPYSMTSDIRSKRFFPDNSIDEFARFLRYDPNKPLMARRDAWSLAYAVRKQNGTHTSNAYEARCIILTRSNLLVSRSAEYLKGDDFAFPPYATIPVMALRRFSTMFLVTFGGDESESVIRSDLISGCEDIVRASPLLVSKIRGVLTSLEKLTLEEIDAALHDPTIVAEFAISTGDDVALVNSNNGAALLDIIRNAAQKDAELRHDEAKAANEAIHAVEVAGNLAQIDVQAKEIRKLRRDVEESEIDRRALYGNIEEQRDLAASILARDVSRKAQVLWRMILGLVIAISLALAADMVFQYTGRETVVGVIGSIILALSVGYAFLLPFFPQLEPKRAQQLFIRRAMRSDSILNCDDDMFARVELKLGLRQSLDMLFC